MAKKKAGGSTRNVRDSQSKRLGVKVFGGQTVDAGAIIVRQRGTKYKSGENTGIGRDHTIFAKAPGVVKYTEKSFKKYDGRKFQCTVINIEGSTENK